VLSFVSFIFCFSRPLGFLSFAISLVRITSSWAWAEGKGELATTNLLGNSSAHHTIFLIVTTNKALTSSANLPRETYHPQRSTA